jgi:hypothetical protein
MGLRQALAILAVALALPATAVATGKSTAPPSTTAKTTTGTSSSATPGTPSTPTTTTGTATKQNNNGDNKTVAGGVLVFALLVIVALLAYLSFIQDKAYGLFEQALGKGTATLHGSSGVAAFVSEDRDALESAGIKVSGPATVTVGKPAEYKATGNGSALAAWSVAGDGATVAPADGGATKLTATAAGSYELTVSVANTSATASITAVEAAPTSAGGVDIPFVGEGYGTVIVAVVLVALAAVLGLLDVLDSSAVATLFGAVAGYIFFTAGAASQGGGQGAPAAAAPHDATGE